MLAAADQSALITTTKVQQMLEENFEYIKIISEKQNQGRPNECIPYQKKLQENLTFLAKIADAQPVQQGYTPQQLQQMQLYQQAQQAQQAQQYAAAQQASAGMAWSQGSGALGGVQQMGVAPGSGSLPYTSQYQASAAHPIWMQQPPTGTAPQL